MKVIKGRYSEAVVFADEVEEIAYAQITRLYNQRFTEDIKIRIMPIYNFKELSI